MNVFGACMAKCCDARHYHLSRLSHFRDRAQELYTKAKTESRVLQLEAVVSDLRIKLFEVEGSSIGGKSC